MRRTSSAEFTIAWQNMTVSSAKYKLEITGAVGATRIPFKRPCITDVSTVRINASVQYITNMVTVVHLGEGLDLATMLQTVYH